MLLRKLFYIANIIILGYIDFDRAALMPIKGQAQISTHPFSEAMSGLERTHCISEWHELRHSKYPRRTTPIETVYAVLDGCNIVILSAVSKAQRKRASRNNRGLPRCLIGNRHDGQRPANKIQNEKKTNKASVL